MKKKKLKVDNISAFNLYSLIEIIWSSLSGVCNLKSETKDKYNALAEVR